MEKIFENTETAFTLKTDAELERAYFLFKMIANEPLVKLGTLMTNFAIKARLPVEGLIRATVFDHFCGGISENDCMGLIDKMYLKNVSAVLDYSVEGKQNEEQFNLAEEKVIKILDFVKEKSAIPFAVFKPSGFGRFNLYVKKSSNIALTSDEEKEWLRVKSRFNRVCKKAFELNVPLLIDSEESWMQNAADLLAEEMMLKYNKKEVIVYNTLQMYRWDRLDYLKKIHTKAIEGNYTLGIKIVRGAYMEKEEDRAEEMGYPNPICASKKATDDNFNNAITYMVDNLESISIFAGTHNEESSYFLMNLMQKKGVDSNDSRVWFGQLLGMSDHISYNLAKHGYNAAKYLPFGPVRDVIPYLIRRAEENTSVSGQTNRELALLKKERKRRKI